MDDRTFFLSRVPNRPDIGCWLWTGTISASGYGRLKRQGRDIFAHRFAYELLVGPIPEGLVIDHLCRTRSCVNPDHLEPVTHAENLRRGKGHPTLRPGKKCKNGHLLTVETIAVRSHDGYLECHICRLASKKRYRKRLKTHRSAT